MSTISLLLIVKYNGKHFFGNAFSDQKTVVGQIIEKLRKYKIEHIRHYWCGRTDRGVSAFNMPLSIELSYIRNFNYEKILQGNNEYYVKAIYAILSDSFELFNRNIDYTERTYMINIRKYTKNRTYSYFIPTKYLHTDFSYRLDYLRAKDNLIEFCKPSEYRLNKEYYDSRKYFLQEGKYDIIDSKFSVLTFTSSGFLYNQIRRMVGYLCDIDLMSPNGLFFTKATIKYGKSEIKYNNIVIPKLDLNISEDLYRDILYEVN